MWEDVWGGEEGGEEGGEGGEGEGADVIRRNLNSSLTFLSFASFKIAADDDFDVVDCFLAAVLSIFLYETEVAIRVEY